MVASSRSIRGRVIFKLFAFCFLSLLYCEYLHYYITIALCQWPKLEKSVTENDDSVYAMVVADTHLLGSRNGHWFDKLRREWQMYRAFQTAQFLHRPDVVIFLGDLFDEGKWCSDKEFESYVSRFSDLFYVSNSTALIVVPGNHDMGFHYSITPNRVRRFEKAFKTPSVAVTEFRGIVFISLNSMALHDDGCNMCSSAKERIKDLEKGLQCRKTKCKSQPSRLLPYHNETYRRPILLQHYPLYRPNDAKCDDIDAAPEEIRNEGFREKWECLAKDTSEELLTKLMPRLVLSGHTHHGCTTLHRHPPLIPLPESPVDDIPADDPEYAAEEAEYRQRQRNAALQGVTPDDQVVIPEINVPSFSWRNKKNPTFAMVTLSSTSHSVSRCQMPREQTVVMLYCSFVVLFLMTFVRKKLWWLAPFYYVFFYRARR